MGDYMIKTKLKFALSADFLLISVVFVIFFNNHLSILTNYIFPIMFIYFVADSLIVLFPILHEYLPSKKISLSSAEIVQEYNKESLKQIKNSNNKKAVLAFILYFGALTVIGLLYLSYDAFQEIHIYLLFLLINMFDYFCILIWCPFKRIIFKNSCCYTCRITNWDRFMKFYILIFIPNIFTISLVVLGIVIFLVWEYHHQTHPERFYSISNKVLRCDSCIERMCNKKKE